MDDSLEDALWTKSSDIESFGGMPAFEIRLISPVGRTPSPIITTDRGEDMEITETPVKVVDKPQLSINEKDSSKDYLVSLQHIDSQISLPRDQLSSPIANGFNNLETIFEDVFLHTPPRQQISCIPKLVARGKENSPNETFAGRSIRFEPLKAQSHDLSRLRAFKYKSIELLCGQADQPSFSDSEN